ncbi:MAG: nicotinate phosphoribosyltransferase [Candidatus Omnitrophica bacterium]|nr:nicotinate phosphoribosyltransferase [Candidatus Omnitrophota bacterium]
MDNALLLDLYELTMAQSYFLYKRNTCATFDLFVRALPVNRAYLVAAGLEDILDYLRNLRFSKSDLNYLRKQKIFSAGFLKYLSTFKFKGDIWAMPEGEIFFAGEPVIRVTANIIEGQIIESCLLNTINLESMIASKAARVVTAAAGRKVYDFALRRTHGAGAGVKGARSAYLAGASGTSCVLAGKLYQVPIAGTMAHSFVMTFKNELESFLAYAETFPQKTILLVDTYDTREGVENAITIGLLLKEKGYQLQGIRLDSGDLAALSKMARKKLNCAGLSSVKIFATGNLDEFKIQKLLKRGACIDCFGVGTNMGTSIDAPCLDVIYKLSEVTDEEKKFVPVMKLSKAKATLPGRKQVFRLEDKKGKFLRDILALEGEGLAGRPLLKKVVASGKIISKQVPLEKTRALVKENLSRFPAGLFNVYGTYDYAVTISPGLKRLKASLSKQLGAKL